MTEYLHELPPSKTTLGVIAEALARMDATGMAFASPEDRAKRFAALLSLENMAVLPAVPIPGGGR